MPTMLPPHLQELSRARDDFRHTPLKDAPKIPLSPRLVRQKFARSIADLTALSPDFLARAILTYPQTTARCYKSLQKIPISNRGHILSPREVLESPHAHTIMDWSINVLKLTPHYVKRWLPMTMCVFAPLDYLKSFVVRYGLTKKGVKSIANSVISAACRNKDPEVVKWVVDEFCLSPEDIFLGHNPFVVSCSGGHLETAKWLRNTFPRDVEQIAFALRCASENGHTHVVEWLENVPPPN